jgi:hypothetical protein
MMTRSIFDPTGPDTEHSGSRNLGPQADDISHMPADVTDGRVDAEEGRDEDPDTRAIAEAEGRVQQQKMGPG